MKYIIEWLEVIRSSKTTVTDIEMSAAADAVSYIIYMNKLGQVVDYRQVQAALNIASDLDLTVPTEAYATGMIIHNALQMKNFTGL